MNYYQDSGDLVIKIYAEDDYTMKYKICRNTVITSITNDIEKRVTGSDGRARRFMLRYGTSDRFNYNAEALFLSERDEKAGPNRTKSSYNVTTKADTFIEMIKEAGGIILDKEDRYFNRLNPKKIIAKAAEEKINANKMSKGDFLKEINSFT